MPIRFGPIGLNPTLAITNFGIDDNIFNDADRPPERLHDDGHPPPPGAAAGRQDAAVGDGRDRAGLLQGIRRRTVRSTTPPTGRVDVDLGWFQPYALASLLDTRERLNAELDVRAPRTQTTARRRDPLRAFPEDRVRGRCSQDRAGVRRTARSSTACRSARRSTRARRTIEGGLELYLTPLTTFAVTASHQTDRFDESPGAELRHAQDPAVDSHGGARDRSGLARGRLPSFLGARPRDPRLQRTRGQGIADAHRSPSGRRWISTLSRDVQYSFEPTEPYYLTTGFRVVVTQQLRESFDVRGIAGRDRLDYREEATSGVPDDTRIDRVERGRRRRRLSLPVKPSHRARRRICASATSDRVDRRYDRTRVFASMTYGF